MFKRLLVVVLTVVMCMMYLKAIADPGCDSMEGPHNARQTGVAQTVRSAADAVFDSVR